MYSVVKIKSIGTAMSNRQEEKFPERFRTYSEAVKWISANTSKFEIDFTEKIPSMIFWKIVSEV